MSLAFPTMLRFLLFGLGIVQATTGHTPSVEACQGLTTEHACNALHSALGMACKWHESSQTCVFEEDHQSMTEHNANNGIATGTTAGTMFQGDLLVTSDNQDVVVPAPASNDGRRNLRNGVQLFPNNVVNYFFDGAYSGSQDAVRDAVHEINEDTNNCIQFAEVASDYDGPAVRIHDEESSSCHVDYVGAPINRGGSSANRVNMNLGWCGTDTNVGSIQHEFLHAMGFYHEQSRPDRDNYITVNYDNIPSNEHAQWDKRETTSVQNLEYDYTSILHYSPRTTSLSTEEDKFTATDARFQDLIGQRSYLSDMDIRGLQLLYNCDITVFSGNIALPDEDWCLYDHNDDGSVTMRECNTRQEDEPQSALFNFHWTYNSGTHQIRAMFGTSNSRNGGVGDCLTAGGETAGSTVSLTNCDESQDEQQWTLGSGQLRLNNEEADLCLTASALTTDASLSLEDCSQTSDLDNFALEEYTEFVDVDYIPTKQPTPSGTYVELDFNTDSCRGHHDITSAEECQEAAADLGVDWRATGRYTFARGCVRLINSNYDRMYYNTYPSGRPTSTTRPVCRACYQPSGQPCEYVETVQPTLSPTASPVAYTQLSGDYLVRSTNNIGCGSSYYAISSSQHCQAAATALGITYSSSSAASRTAYPSGCVLLTQTNRLYWNTRSGGRAYQLAAQICSTSNSWSGSSSNTASSDSSDDGSSNGSSSSGAFVLTNTGTCPSGSAYITTTTACQGAATQEGLSYRSNLNSSYFPRGCFKYYTSVYRNSHSTGGTSLLRSTSQNIMLICQQTTTRRIERHEGMIRRKIEAEIIHRRNDRKEIMRRAEEARKTGLWAPIEESLFEDALF